MTRPVHESVGTLVGILGGARAASVGPSGTVRPERALWELDWWIGAEDRWYLPAREAAVRQSLVDGMPVVRTAMRVPGGDAIQRVFGATGDSVVVDVENASAVPFVAAFVVRGAGQVALDDTTMMVDGVPALAAVRPPSRWVAATDGSAADVVMAGNAMDGPMPVLRDRGARIEAAFLFPVAHRTRLRVAVALGRNDTPGVAGIDDLMSLPSAEDVARGWQAQLDRGMRVEVPDPGLQSAIDAARPQLLLAGQARRAEPEVVAALEDWGFDGEALSAWNRLGVLARRRASRRPRGPGWGAVRARVGVIGGSPRPPAPFLGAIRRLLVQEVDDAIELLHDWPVEWRGLPLDVRDAPTRFGTVSFSVRWHGERPALIWEVPGGVLVRAPGLDPTWSSSGARGESLLAAGA